jgi:transcription elongation factor GreB
LREELRRLLNEERPRLVEIVAWAAGNGDRSENGDYIYGKRRLGEIDKRIRFLTQRMDYIEIVDPKKLKSDTVLFGASVTLADENGNKKSFQIVGIDETDARLGKISWISPLGKALLGHEVGDLAEVKAPGGTFEYEIIDIEYI